MRGVGSGSAGEGVSKGVTDNLVPGKEGQKRGDESGTESERLLRDRHSAVLLCPRSRFGKLAKGNARHLDVSHRGVPLHLHLAAKDSDDVRASAVRQGEVRSFE